MRKKIVSLFSFLILFLFPIYAKAASVSVKINAPSSVYVGDSVKVSVTLSSSTSIGSWQYNISYDDALLTYVSSTSEAPQSVANNATAAGKSSVTYTWNFKAKNSGSVSFKINGIAVYAYDDESEMTVSGSTAKSIKINKPSSNNSGSNNKYTYSGNNYLSSLKIEGYDIEFNKDTLEYSVNVPNDVSVVKIGATAEDSKASVSGIGDFEVKEGNNPLHVVVTAENGNTKTYTVTVNVLELSPIVVKVGNNEFTVVRKSDLLPNTLVPYTSDRTLVKGENVPCLYNEIANLYLVGLRDIHGNVSLYRYENDTFYSFDEMSLGGIYISLSEPDTVPKGYASETIKINDKDVTVYTKEGTFPLIYGMNLETGKTGFYTYDSLENTIQRIENFEENDDFVKHYPIITICLLCLIIIQFIIMIILVNSKNKQNRKLIVDKLSEKKEKKDFYSDNIDITKTLSSIKSNNLSDDLSNDIQEEKNDVKIKKEKLSKKDKKKLKDDDMYKF